MVETRSADRRTRSGCQYAPTYSNVELYSNVQERRRRNTRSQHATGRHQHTPIPSLATLITNNHAQV